MSEKKVTFGRVFWPSLVAGITLIIVFFLVIFGVIGGLVSSETSSLKVEKNTILHMRLDGEIAEKGETKFNPGSFQMDSKLGLSSILFGLQEAASDERIKGIYLELGSVSCGLATARELRNAINKFEESGKFVVAYNTGEVVPFANYYISSAANEVYGFPTTNMAFVGLGAELAFFKTTLDNLDVEMQVIRGKNNDFKSAVEPFFRNDMSDSSRVQVERYLTSIWEDMRNDIAADRNVSAQKLNEYAENITIRDCDDAVKYKLMDGTKYQDEVIAILKEKVGAKEDEDLSLLEFSKFASKKFVAKQKIANEDEPNIAVILAEGGVAVDGDGLTSKEICKLFKDARENKTIKTVVFRINSPGGSALASDEIWREVKLTNEVKKVIVSMGDVAASGGYYIASPAATIFAEPTTITGSIGVFGVIPYTGKMLENHLGLTFDRASTNSHSVLTTNRKLDEQELGYIQEEVDNIYDQFLGRVAEGRGMTKEHVNVIARGRVWTGRDALRIGLVDKLGGIQDAINHAATQAGIKDQKILYYPLVKEDKFAEFIEQLEEDESIRIQSSQKLPKELVKHFDHLMELENYSGIQMRLPYVIEFH